MQQQCLKVETVPTSGSAATTAGADSFGSGTGVAGAGVSALAAAFFPPFFLLPGLLLELSAAGIARQVFGSDAPQDDVARASVTSHEYVSRKHSKLKWSITQTYCVFVGHIPDKYAMNSLMMLSR